MFPAAAQSESVTVTPASSLEDGDLVTVAGTGFTPGTEVFLLLCNSDTRLGDALGRCALIGDGALGYTVGTAGLFIAASVAIPVGQVGATGLATCPPSAAQLARGVTCSIQVSNVDLVKVASSEVAYSGQPVAVKSDLAFTGPHQGALVWVAVALFVFGAMAHTGGWIIERRSRLT